MGNVDSCETCGGRTGQFEFDEGQGRRAPEYPTSETDVFTQGPARLDPRHQLAAFLGKGDEQGPAGFLKQKGLLPGREETNWFAVFRPTSADAISKMMDGQGTGKGLNVKGKSAKTGCLSGFVPVLQISDNEHKSQVCTSPREARVRVYYPSDEHRSVALFRLRKVLAEMRSTSELAAQRLEAHQAGTKTLTDDEERCAFIELLFQVEDPSIINLNLYEPEAFGLDLPERLFREVYVAQPDISRHGAWQTGRASEPAFMDMNLYVLRDVEASPRAVMWQNDSEDALNPLSLLMAYEEEKVKPVVSDFDAFMLGCSGNIRFEPLPPDQVDMMKWCLGHIEEVLSTPSKAGWMSRWLEILKRESDRGFHPEIPRFGFGDPTSYGIVEQLVVAMGLLGAVRHGAECFNFYFPQDLDDEFLVIWPGFGADQPWQYLSESDLRDFLLDCVQRGYSFPLNPKWIICDQGWRAVFQRLRYSPQGKRQLAAWFPSNSKLIERIEELCDKFPAGFQKPEGVEELDIDLAELQLRRYETLQRAKRKLRVVLRWMKLNKGKGLSNGEGQALKEDPAIEADQHRTSDKPDSMKPLAVADDKAEKKSGCLGCCKKK